MHITGMTIDGELPFVEPVEFTFDRRANLFIGPNSTGKSSILLHLARLCCRPSRVRTHTASLGISVAVSEDWPGRTASPEDGSFAYIDYKELPAIFIPSIRLDSTPNTFTRSPRNFIADTDFRYDMGQRIYSESASREVTIE